MSSQTEICRMAQALPRYAHLPEPYDPGKPPGTPPPKTPPDDEPMPPPDRPLDPPVQEPPLRPPGKYVRSTTAALGRSG